MANGLLPSVTTLPLASVFSPPISWAEQEQGSSRAHKIVKEMGTSKVGKEVDGREKKGGPFSAAPSSTDFGRAAFQPPPGAYERNLSDGRRRLPRRGEGGSGR